jgi:adenosylhomocysteine nucleosidase
VQVHQVGGRDVHVGLWHGQPVAAVWSRIGKVAAATTATLLHCRFGVSHIVFTGVAGGLGPDVAVGDLVLATQLVQHDMDASPLFPRFELPGTGCSHLPADLGLSGELARAFAALPERCDQWPVLQASPFVRPGGSRLHPGLILSGDRFIGDAATGRGLLEALPEALAVEMEGAAVAQVCHDLGLPFAVIRAISDRADAQAHIDFAAFLDAVASPMAAAWLDLWLRSRLSLSAVA